MKIHKFITFQTNLPSPFLYLKNIPPPKGDVLSHIIYIVHISAINKTLIKIIYLSNIHLSISKLFHIRHNMVGGGKHAKRQQARRGSGRAVAGREG